jgi:hypothetical protein
VDKDHRGKGAGSALLAALIIRCENIGLRQMVAIIGDSDNAGSIALHRSKGFLDVGVLRSVGYKFDQWVDSTIMQLPLLGNHTSREPLRRLKQPKQEHPFISTRAILKPESLILALKHSCSSCQLSNNRQMP